MGSDGDKSGLVVAIGELVVDWLAQEKSTGFIETSTFIKSLGGNASNVAIGLSRLGTPSRIVAKVGPDVHGKFLLKVLEDEGVDTRFVKIDESSSTAQCYVFTTVNDDNTFLNWPPGNAASKLTKSDIPSECLKDAACVHATGISLVSEPRKSALLDALSRIEEAGGIISFDAGFPTGEGEEAKNAVEEAIKAAHIVKVNLSELFFWCSQFGVELSDADREVSLVYERPPSSGHESLVSSAGLSVTQERIEELADVLFEEVKPLILAVTLAERGSYLLSRTGRSWRRSIVVDYVAGVGAGDAFMAGLLHALSRLEGKKLERSALEILSTDELDEVNRFAGIVGALATTHESAYEGLPDRASVLRHLPAASC